MIKEMKKITAEIIFKLEILQCIHSNLKMVWVSEFSLFYLLDIVLAYKVLFGFL